MSYILVKAPEDEKVKDWSKTWEDKAGGELSPKGKGTTTHRAGTGTHRWRKKYNPETGEHDLMEPRVSAVPQNIIAGQKRESGRRAAEKEEAAEHKETMRARVKARKKKYKGKEYEERFGSQGMKGHWDNTREDENVGFGSAAASRPESTKGSGTLTGTGQGNFYAGNIPDPYLTPTHLDHPDHPAWLGIDEGEHRRHILLSEMLQNMLLTDSSKAADELGIPELGVFGEQLQGMTNDKGKLTPEGRRAATAIITPIMRSLGGGHGPAALAELGFRFANTGGERAMRGLAYAEPTAWKMQSTLSSLTQNPLPTKKKPVFGDPMKEKEGQLRGLERAAAEFRVPDNVKGQFIDQIQALMEQGKSRTDALDEVVADMRSDRLIPIGEKSYGRFSEGESHGPIPSIEDHHEMLEQIGQRIEDEPDEAGVYGLPTADYMWDRQYADRPDQQRPTDSDFRSHEEEAQALERKRGAKAARSKREAFAQRVGVAEGKKRQLEELRAQLQSEDEPEPESEPESVPKFDDEEYSRLVSEGVPPDEAVQRASGKPLETEQVAMAPDVAPEDKTVGEMRAEGTLPQEEPEAEATQVVPPVDIGRQASGLSDEEHARFFGKSLGSELLESILDGMWR